MNCIVFVQFQDIFGPDITINSLLRARAMRSISYSLLAIFAFLAKYISGAEKNLPFPGEVFRSGAYCIPYFA